MEAYKLFLDKTNNFQCKLELEGASLHDASVRVILEGKNRNYLYEGKITDSGECEVKLERLNEVFKSGESGKMKLEVIADEAYFSPWESDYVTDSSKKLRIEVMSPTETPKKPTIKVEVKQEPKLTKQEEFNRLVEFVTDKVKASKITPDKVNKNKSKIIEKIWEVSNKCVHKHDPDKVLSEVIKKI
jgi:hypothetical protein